MYIFNTYFYIHITFQFKNDGWKYSSDCLIFTCNLKEIVLIKFLFKDYENIKFFLW